MITPLPFEPILLEKVWGGFDLHRVLGTPPGLRPVGEAWCFSPLADRPTRVAMGPLKGLTVPEALEQWRLKVPSLPVTVPILIKILESTAPLSLQVHPDEAQARAHGDGPTGKAEVWQVLSADPDTRILHGFQEGVTREMVQERVFHEPAALVELCHSIPVTAGDVIPVPPGTVHTILGRMVWAEIQQAADLTYRIYDWGRSGPDRPLHVEKAMSVLAFDRRLPVPAPAVSLGPGRRLLWASRWFSIEEVRVEGWGHLLVEDPLEVWLCLEGPVTVDLGEPLLLAPGWTMLFAGAGEYPVRTPSSGRLIRVRVTPLDELQIPGWLRSVPAEALDPVLYRDGSGR